MRRIVAPDAVDAADRKYIGLADDGDCGGADRKNGFRAGLRLGRNALCRGASQRQRAGCEDGPAIEGTMSVLLLCLFLLFILLADFDRSAPCPCS
jgi:hypothetical protein